MSQQPPQDSPLEISPLEGEVYQERPVGQGAQQNQQEYQEEEQYEEESSNKFLLFNAVPSWMISMIVHSILIIILMFFNLPEQERTVVELNTTPEDETEVVEEEEVKIEPMDVQEFEDAEVQEEVAETEEITETFEDVPTDMAALDSNEMALEFEESSEILAPTAEIAMSVGSLTSTGVESRSSSNKKSLLKDGGNGASEEAVAAALRWIAAHQLPDGGWSFDHTIGPGNFRNSTHPGSMADARNGATAMALLPFLGAGMTHREGQYKKVVEGGLKYLITHQKPGANGTGSFFENGGRMYSHGLCAILLGEAYAMSKDPYLKVPAQAAMNFIVAAQDPVGGGWRYQPGQPGDTSVVGWQIMALKSGSMGFLNINPNTVKKSIKYLDTVSADGGAYYGYTGPSRSPTNTAIGLLCRMYLGWDQEHPGLRKGIDFLAGQGPSLGDNANMYYNYYATQIMRHNGKSHWDLWNTKMRDFLVKTQERKGNASGSWHFNGGHGAERGGRLYNTSLSTMVLEVYYRHMPIYKGKAATDEFQLD